MKGVLAIQGFDRRFVCQVRGVEREALSSPDAATPVHTIGLSRVETSLCRAASSLPAPALGVPAQHISLGCPLPLLPQGVHMLFEGMPDRPWKEGEKRTSKMVFIGKDLDGALLKEGFEACRVKPDDAPAS